jgi:hypothetical protein
MCQNQALGKKTLSKPTFIIGSVEVKSPSTKQEKKLVMIGAPNTIK